MSADEPKESAGDAMKKMMAAGGMKPEKVSAIAGIEKKEDFAAATAALLAEAAVMAAAGELDRAIEQLFALEKKCRLGNDIPSLKTVVTGMCQLCKDRVAWDKLSATVATIAKRHQQHRHAITAVLVLCMPWVTEAPDDATKVTFLKTLRDVTDGKLFAEGERAKLTRDLAVIKEAEGDVGAACDIMLEVYVETFGALSKREKIDFILEQIRLCIAKGDWVRVMIVQKKVQRKFLEETDMQDLKLRFYGLLVEVFLREKDALELAQAYHAMASTPCKADDEGDASGWRHCVKGAVLFLVLAPRSPAQADMLARVAAEERLEKLPEWAATVKLFTTHEIIAFPLASQGVIEAQLQAVLAQYAMPEAFKHWQLMTHERATQHNLRVAAKYYARIRMPRLAHLLGLSPDETEKQLATLVSEGQVTAKIDRPAGLVTFAPKVTAEETLSAWSSDLGNLLSLVERTCHLINKENMIHKVV